MGLLQHISFEHACLESEIPGYPALPRKSDLYSPLTPVKRRGSLSWMFVRNIFMRRGPDYGLCFFTRLLYFGSTIFYLLFSPVAMRLVGDDPTFIH
ncbi:hypothetical protein SAMN05216308_101487 [Nitrosospira sp. Nsp13]|nr:hypothetical protein SAMN05216308_101487 [Nitrosospira sp. Nsp13]